MVKTKKIEIEIKDLELSKFNPRFTFLEKMDLDLVDFIKNGNQNYSEKKVSDILLENEGNLKDMLNLINSIVNSGWIDLGEQLIVIESGSKYIVAEGNRRLLALKLLLGIIELKDLKSMINKTTNQDMHLDEELMNESDLKSNYRKIKDLIDSYNKDSDPILKNGKLMVDLVYKSDDLWTMLYTKHISGERPGMRQWKRGKYFVDILNFFPSGVNKNDKDLAKKVSITLRRDISAIFRDFIQAQFVRDMFESINNDMEITKENIKNSNVSALETTYSLKHIKNILKKELNYSDKQFEDMFNIGFDDNGIIRYSGNLNRSNLFQLIIKYYKKGVLKTRPIKDEDYNNIAKEVVQVFSGLNFDDNNEISNNELEDKDIFSFTTNQIDNLLITSPGLTEENKKKLKNAKKIMKNDAEINEIFRKDEMSISKEGENVFKYLNLQLKHNSNGAFKYTHAQAFTLRTIMEEFFIWGIYFSPNHLKMLYPEVKESDQQTHHVKKLSDEKELILKLTKRAEKNLEAIHVKEILNGICENVSNDLVRFFLEFYNKDSMKRKKSRILNGFIHAYHRFMGVSEENKMLEEILNVQENILFILKNLKWDKISILNSKIKENIKTLRNEQ